MIKTIELKNIKPNPFNTAWMLKHARNSWFPGEHEKRRYARLRDAKGRVLGLNPKPCPVVKPGDMQGHDPRRGRAKDG